MLSCVQDSLTESILMLRVVDFMTYWFTEVML